MRIIRIPVDGEPMEEEVGGDLGSMQSIVGGWLEVVALDRKTFLYLNEEGKLNGLPVNREATRITREILSFDDLIVGNAFISEIDDEGESVDLRGTVRVHEGIVVM